MTDITASGLRKSLAARHITMISFGGIIGAGLFVGSSASIASAGPGIVVSYLLAGMVILMVMRMLAEMAMLHPEAGSLVEFARLGLGNWAGFTSGWLYWYFWVIVVAFEAIAGAKLIQEWLPMPIWQIGSILLVLMTIINLMSTRSYGEFEFWFSTIKVLAIVVFIAVAGMYVIKSWLHGGEMFANLTGHGGFLPKGVAAVFGGVTSVLFALVGAEIATIAAAESKEPARAIARITQSIVLRILLFYVLSILLIVMVVPWDAIKVGTSPFATTLEQVGIPTAALIMKWVVLTAILSCLNSGLYVTSRVLFTLASHSDAPQSMVVLNARKVPARAILIGSAMAFLAVVASAVSPDHIFAFLLNASGAIMLVIYLLIALAHIRLRRALSAADEAALPIKVWLFPWLSYASIAAMTAVLVSMAFNEELASQLWASVLCTALFLLAYFLLRHKVRETAVLADLKLPS